MNYINKKQQLLFEKLHIIFNKKIQRKLVHKWLAWNWILHQEMQLLNLHKILNSQMVWEPKDEAYSTLHIQISNLLKESTNCSSYNCRESSRKSLLYSHIIRRQWKRYRSLEPIKKYIPEQQVSLSRKEKK